jgi:hypothetical protein
MIEIKEYPGYYITLEGEIWSSFTKSVMKTRESTGHYLTVRLWKNRKEKVVTVHRLVGKYLVPNPLNKPCINHKDHNRHNNNPNNLEWVTYSENLQHAWRDGTKVVTEVHIKQCKENGISFHNKATEASRKRIKWIHPEHGEFYGTQSDLKREYNYMNLDQRTLSKVLHNKVKHHKQWRVKI